MWYVNNNYIHVISIKRCIIYIKIHSPQSQKNASTNITPEKSMSLNRPCMIHEGPNEAIYTPPPSTIQLNMIYGRIFNIACVSTANLYVILVTCKGRYESPCVWYTPLRPITRTMRRRNGFFSQISIGLYCPAVEDETLSLLA